MPIKIQHEDPATGFHNKVDDDGALFVSEKFSPPFGTIDFIQPIAIDFSNGSTTDMRVDGSVTAQEFFITTDQERARPADRYINTIVFSIGDQNTKLRDFGAIARLTNGCRLFYESERGDVIIRSGLRSNFDFMRLSAYPAFGADEGVGRFLTAVGTAANSYDVYMPVLNFARTFGTQFGVKLGSGSTQRIVLEVNDDITGVDEFTAIGYGFDRIDTRTKITATQQQQR